MNRKQWFASGFIFIVAAYYLWSTADYAGSLSTTGQFLVPVTILVSSALVLGAIGVSSLVCGLLETEGKKK